MILESEAPKAPYSGVSKRLNITKKRKEIPEENAVYLGKPLPSSKLPNIRKTKLRIMPPDKTFRGRIDPSKPGEYIDNMSGPLITKINEQISVPNIDIYLSEILKSLLTIFMEAAEKCGNRALIKEVEIKEKGIIIFIAPL